MKEKFLKCSFNEDGQFFGCFERNAHKTLRDIESFFRFKTTQERRRIKEQLNSKKKNVDECDAVFYFI